MDNIVAVFDSDDECEILFFELVKGNQLNNLIYNESLMGKPHIKIYLRDSQDYIYLFETNLPAQFMDIVVSTSEECDIYKDYLWYLKIVDSYIVNTDLSNDDTAMLITDIDNEANIIIGNNVNNIEIIKRNIAIASGQTYSGSEGDIQLTSDDTTTRIWGGTKTYQAVTENVYERCTHYFYPTGEFRISEVPTSGGIWYAQVGVAEHTKTEIIGTTITGTVYGVNRFCLKDIEISSVCGNKTQFLTSFFDGVVQTCNGSVVKVDGEEIAAKLMEKVFDVVPGGKTASEILEWLSTITLVKSNALIIGDEVTLHDSNVLGVRVSLGEDYCLEKYTKYKDENGIEKNNGHKAHLQIIPGRTTTNAGMTTGAFRICYKVYQDSLVLKEERDYVQEFRYSETTFAYGDGLT